MLGKWLMLRPLDKGAFGVAWLAEDSTKRDTFAVIKFLAGSPLEEPIEITKARFEREREILASLDNQHVCKLLDDDLNSSPPWVAVDYLPGKSLQGTVSENYKLDETEWFRLASDMLNGLAYLHKQKIIHRDLNPKNILVTSLGYKIIDFGISHKRGLPQVTVGNLHHFLFSSPEQFVVDGKITVKSDIFCLASLLVFAGTNRSPWTDDPNAMNENISPATWGEIPINTQNNPPRYHSLGSNQKQLLQRMHQKDPSLRPTAEDALELLKSLATKAFLTPVTSTPKVATAKKASIKSKPVPVAKSRVSKLPLVKPVVQRVASAGGGNPRLEISENRVRVRDEVSSSLPSKTFLEKYWKDILFLWFTTPVGWLIYRAYLKKKSLNTDGASNTVNEFKGWKIGFLLTHGFSFGFFGPIAGIPFAAQIKSRAISIFMAINFFAVLYFFGEIVSTPTGEETATSVSVVWVLNYIYGFFLPLVMRLEKGKKKRDTPPLKIFKPASEIEESEKIDPFDDEDYLAIGGNILKMTSSPQNSWVSVKETVIEVLKYQTIESFQIEFSKTSISGIYFQGFRDESGCVTIEASSSRSVSPEITRDQNRNIIRAGWEPPTQENPNYVRFLNLTESNFEFISNLIVDTLQNGYSTELEGLIPIFKVISDGEITHLNFEEFKALFN
jgi:serine/threonine protein kinase